jgi:hypothetical protein
MLTIFKGDGKLQFIMCIHTSEYVNDCNLTHVCEVQKVTHKFFLSSVLKQQLKVSVLQNTRGLVTQVRQVASGRVATSLPLTISRFTDSIIYRLVQKERTF